MGGTSVSPHCPLKSGPHLQCAGFYPSDVLICKRWPEKFANTKVTETRFMALTPLQMSAQKCWAGATPQDPAAAISRPKAPHPSAPGRKEIQIAVEETGDQSNMWRLRDATAPAAQFTIPCPKTGLRMTLIHS